MVKYFMNIYIYICLILYKESYYIINFYIIWCFKYFMLLVFNDIIWYRINCSQWKTLLDIVQLNNTVELFLYENKIIMCE